MYADIYRYLERYIGFRKKNNKDLLLLVSRFLDHQVNYYYIPYKMLFLYRYSYIS